PINNDDVVNIALDGLPDKYHHVSDIIIHRDPFPDLKTVRSMLTTTEMRLKSRAHASYIDSTSSSPMVLLANSGTNNRRSTSSMEKTPTDIKNDDMRTLQTLMAKLGFDSTTLSPVSDPTNTTRHIALHTNTTGHLGLLGQHPYQAHSSTVQQHSQPGQPGLMGQPTQQFYQPGQFGLIGQSGYAGQPGQQGGQPGSHAPTTGQETLFANVFHAVTL
ncbi:hypothetical protein Tco_1390502, partial [Tanacetum coccineum]